MEKSAMVQWVPSAEEDSPHLSRPWTYQINADQITFINAVGKMAEREAGRFTLIGHAGRLHQKINVRACEKTL